MAPNKRSKDRKTGSPKILRQRKVTKKLCRTISKNLFACCNGMDKENVPPGGRVVHHKSCDQRQGCGSCNKAPSMRNKNATLTAEEIVERNARERQRVHAVNDQYQVGDILLKK